MARCSYCGEPAGIFRSLHRRCSEAMERDKSPLTRQAVAVIQSAMRIDPTGMARLLQEDLVAASVDPHAAPHAWRRAVESVLDNHMMSETEEANIWALHQALSLRHRSPETLIAESLVTQARALRDIQQGTAPSNLPHAREELPFNFQKTERLIWSFERVDYYEAKRRVRYHGRSQGVSLRIARGVYYRIGGHAGERVETYETVHADTGVLAITSRHLYFAGDDKSFRIRHDRIVSYHPYTDGIGVVRDVANAREQLFLTGDGWFTQNLIAVATYPD